MAVGFAVTVTPVVALNPVAGAQVYVLAPLAVIILLVPEQIAGAEGETVTVGVTPTEINTVCVSVHPVAAVPVTVYVVVTVGEAVTVAPVVALNPVAGPQV